MATLTLDYLSRCVARDLIDQVATQKSEAVRHIVGVRRALKLRDLAADLDKLTPKQLMFEALLDYNPDQYEVERGDLEWLREQMQAKDWSQRTDQAGHTIAVPLGNAYLEGVVNLMDAVARALDAAPQAA